MFFESLDSIPKIAEHTNCAIFSIPEYSSISLKNSFSLSPLSDKQTISVEQVRDFTAKVNTKQTKDCFMIISPAESMTEAAQNAFLKHLEEPQAHVHYILITTKPYLLLPTILSRSQVFYLRQINAIDQPPSAPDNIKEMAKKLISSSPNQLPAIANDISKHKEARPYALNIISVSIELLYKSYFKTKNDKFLEKIPKFLKLYDNIQNNGHIKLHLVADLC